MDRQPTAAPPDRERTLGRDRTKKSRTDTIFGVPFTQETGPISVIPGERIAVAAHHVPHITHTFMQERMQ
jgi:hypothetical protein